MKRAKEKFLDRLRRTRPKTHRKRWLGQKGQIFEEDTRHGDLEKYNRRGKHEGTVDPETGEIIKDPVRGRDTEV